ncbi:hypothetical protein QRX50_04045 [Amycolatopsis carbonis]|uniref:Uncharacterized protein n=1 Tax=Amycolatopsis carbonis TaxID=715471 RepID=A0A9Y2IKG2_9PSEU|nr:hypothetical protein [Amycolatopsis sp. 2-15]WIX79978.1 hypothetical protein QRX50_04045 [Amycolatopsis sp. 2-15]
MAAGNNALNIDGEVVGGYAAKVALAADELDTAAGGVGAGATTGQAYGELGGRLGLDRSYARASGALRQQLQVGAAALRSAAEALDQLTAGHAQRDADAAEQIKRAGGLS